MKNSIMILRYLLILLVIISCSSQKKLGDASSSKVSESQATTASEEKIAKPQKVKDEYYKSNFLRYEDYIYHDNIKTIKFYRDGFELSPPMYDINTTDKLVLAFDDLEGGVKNYKYYFIHCDADWKPSNISDYEFMTGFNEDFINQYKFSYNTRQKYAHYELNFPNDNMKLITSGNYLLVVFIDGNKDEAVFTRRFWVVQPKVTINAIIKRPIRVDDRNYKQELDFSIVKNGYEILNPYTDLKVVVTQNGRWDNALVDVKPQVIKGDMIEYNLNGEIIFNGGNEFRRFDIKSLKYNSERIKYISTDTISGKYSVDLQNDDRRPFKVYLKDQDINGRYLIKSEDNARDSDREGDYVWVNFTLPYSAPISEGDIYVMGALTDWRFNKENKLIYNYQTRAYEIKILLKQGYYNYYYVYLQNGQNVGDETLVEGNHFETENQYTIFVYNREPGTSFDRLVGLKQLNTLSY